MTAENQRKAPFINHFRRLTSYGRTLEYYRIMFCEGPFSAVKEKKSTKREVELLDQINYSKSLFDDPLPLVDILNLFQIEPGYGVPDGSYEIGPFVRNLELTRAELYLKQNNEDGYAACKEAIMTSTVGIGHGVTGALTTTIGCIIRTRGPCSTNIVTVSPNYCIADEIARLYNLEVKNYRCVRENEFLPDFIGLKEICDQGTAAICITLPTNPSHNAWTSNESKKIKNFIHWCQDQDIFFVLDAIFQDTSVFGNIIPEPFALVGSNYCITKVFGPSKDRPFACGHRIGYYIGDSRLSDDSQHLSHIMLNSPNFYSKLWFAFELLFRSAFIRGKNITISDFELFEESFLFGEYFNKITPKDIFNQIYNEQMYSQYCYRTQASLLKIRSTMKKVYNYFVDCPYFTIHSLPKYGNSLFIKINPTFYYGTDHDFFWEVLIKKNIGILVGNAFGFPFPCKTIWFRVVCVADDSETIIKKLNKIVDLLRSQRKK